jgi:hypothetical protein
MYFLQSWNGDVQKIKIWNRQTEFSMKKGHTFHKDGPFGKLSYVHAHIIQRHYTKYEQVSSKAKRLVAYKKQLEMDWQGQSIIPTTQLPIQAVPITITFVSLIPIHDEMYLMQIYVIKLFVTCDRSVIFKVYCHDIIEIFWK